MPYRLVLTKNGPNEEVSAVPEGWVVGSNLYWPRSLKKSEIESLRSNENSIPDKSWKKIKCRLKLSDICSFEEALHLEDLYSKFQDTEDEKMYLNERQNKKTQTVNALSKQLLDVNSEFDIDDNNITHIEISSEEVKVKIDENTIKNVAHPDEINVQILSSDNQDNIQATLNHVQGTSTINDDTLMIRTSELLKIIQENNSLQIENKALKEELLHSVEFQNETKKNFAIMQTQMDKIIDLLQNKNQDSSSIIANDGVCTSEDGIDKIIIDNLKFPIETKEQLDALEHKLLEKDVMAYLVKKFSETCGTSGIARISKVGLSLMTRFIKDELLNQFTWKGIKGSTKMPFVQYVKIRELFYKVAHLADRSCSFNDSDSFIQNSAIKHSGQRMKRHILSSESKMNVKRTKKDINIMEKDSTKEKIPNTGIIDNVITEEKDKENIYGVNDNDINEENSYITENNNGSETNKKITDGDFREIDENEMDEEKPDREKHRGLKKEADDFTNTMNQPSCSKIKILSDVKICNKALDIKNVKKMANISSTNVGAIFDGLIKFSP